MMKFDECERPIIIQIFGDNADSMAKAAKIVEQEMKPDGIDINFGCPVQKAAKQGFGAVQLSDSAGSAKIVEAVKKVLKHTPLSIKIRLVSKNVQDSVDFVSKMVDAGIDMIAIHGRTPTQKYGGTADWSHAYAIKQAFPQLIVLGSGDIRSKEDLENKLGNLDGALVGRAAKVHPEIFCNLAKIKNR
jgi:tRNA-dihydrouridine synthase B